MFCQLRLVQSWFAKENLPNFEPPTPTIPNIDRARQRRMIQACRGKRIADDLQTFSTTPARFPKRSCWGNVAFRTGKTLQWMAKTLDGHQLSEAAPVRSTTVIGPVGSRVSRLVTSKPLLSITHHRDTIRAGLRRPNAGRHPADESFHHTNRQCTLENTDRVVPFDFSICVVQRRVGICLVPCWLRAWCGFGGCNRPIAEATPLLPPPLVRNAAVAC